MNKKIDKTATNAIKILSEANEIISDAIDYSNPKSINKNNVEVCRYLVEANLYLTNLISELVILETKEKILGHK